MCTHTRGTAVTSVWTVANAIVLAGDSTVETGAVITKPAIYTSSNNSNHNNDNGDETTATTVTTTKR